MFRGVAIASNNRMTMNFSGLLFVGRAIIGLRKENGVYG
jgi:hypothetical protein